jgi:hypothetical protein
LVFARAKSRIANRRVCVQDVPVLESAYSVRNNMTDPQPGLPGKPISELVSDPDFPNSAVGEKVDIKGNTGVIVEVVKNSIKVRSAEGKTMSYNFHTLRKLYGPRIAPEEPTTEPAPAISPASPPEAKRDIILEPNFNSPLVPIESLVHRPDFPHCARGVFIDLHGFTGVMVELVDRSMKVRSREGSTHSYNADGLRKIYGNLSPNAASVKA